MGLTRTLDWNTQQKVEERIRMYESEIRKAGSHSYEAIEGLMTVDEANELNADNGSHIQYLTDAVKQMRDALIPKYDVDYITDLLLQYKEI